MKQAGGGALAKAESVQCIIAERKVDGKQEFRVRFKGVLRLMGCSIHRRSKRMCPVNASLRCTGGIALSRDITPAIGLSCVEFA